MLSAGFPSCQRCGQARGSQDANKQPGGRSGIPISPWLTRACSCGRCRRVAPEQRAEEVVHGWGSGTHSLRRGGNETAAGPGLEAAPAAGRLSCKSGQQTAAGRRSACRDPGPLLGHFVGHLDLQAALPTCVLWSLHFCGASGCVLSDFSHTFGWLTSQQCSVPPSFPRCARCVSVLLPPEPTQGPLRQAASFQVSLLPQELVISGASRVPGKKKNQQTAYFW